ncbi:MAG: glycosyltransferase family 1 protein [Candidatus Omnitrophota bacterium]
MRIGFDARMITHPGIGRYIKSLLPEMIRQAGGDEFVIFGDQKELVNIAGAGNARIVEWNAPIYSLQEQVFLPYRGKKLDILHVPHFNVPVSYRGKMVVTIHDLIYLLFPGAGRFGLAKHYAGFMAGKALEKADKIITVSKHTEKDLLGMYGGQYAGKVEVIHEAADRMFRQITDKTRSADVQCRHRLSDRIILYVGSIKAHKNVQTLLKVFTLLKKWGAPHQLVICGRWDKKQDMLKAEMIDSGIRYLGEVSTDDLIVLYNIADVLVHLSFYEGFGLTALEAMQCGTPVIVSDSSSLPEVAGEAACSVSPHNVEQIADTVYNVLVNAHLREGMIERGLKHVKQFSWEETARRTLEVYRKVC